MTKKLLVASVVPDAPTQLLLAGIFQLASEPTATERGHLHLRMNYITPQTKRDGSHVKMLVRVWLPINDPVAIQASALELHKGDYVYAVGWAELEYERTEPRDDRPGAVFATITFRDLRHIDRVDTEQVESALAQLDETIAARLAAAQQRRTEKPQPPQRAASAATPQPAAATTPTKPRAVSSANWSDMPQGVSLTQKAVDDLEDPFADMEEPPLDGS